MELIDKKALVIRLILALAIIMAVVLLVNAVLA